MKNRNVNKNFLLKLLSFTLMLFLFNCTSPSQEVKNPKEDLSQIQNALIKAENEVAAEITSFKNESNQLISANEVRIAQLKAQMKRTGKSAKASYKEQIEILEQKNTAMKTRISEYKDTGKENWISFKNGFVKDMDLLNQSLNDCIADLNY